MIVNYNNKTYRLGLVTSGYQVRVPVGTDICHRGCVYTVLQTVKRHWVYRATYGTVHYKEPLRSFEIRVGHSPGFGLHPLAILRWVWKKRRKAIFIPSVTILSKCAESNSRGQYLRILIVLLGPLNKNIYKKLFGKISEKEQLSTAVNIGEYASMLYVVFVSAATKKHIYYIYFGTRPLRRKRRAIIGSIRQFTHTI